MNVLHLFKATIKYTAGRQATSQIASAFWQILMSSFRSDIEHGTALIAACMDNGVHSKSG